MAKTAMAVKPKKKKNGIGQYILSLCLLIYTAYCALPLILVVISSFTDDTELKKDGFTYFPYKWSTAGMNAILRYGKQLGTSYMVTIFVTVVGTLLGLLVMSMFAYSLHFGLSSEGFASPADSADHGYDHERHYPEDLYREQYS